MDNWTTVVITCSSSTLAACIEHEVTSLKTKGQIPSSVPILTIEDPADHMGSGAATVNGLLVAAEYLSAENNYSVINSDVLEKSHILILHQGRDSIYSIGGKSLLTVPRHWLVNGAIPLDDHYSHDTCSNIELLLTLLGNLSKDSGPGVWVCSTDMSLIMDQVDPICWQSMSDVILFTVSCDIEYALHHGSVNTDNENIVRTITYRGSTDVIKTNIGEDGKIQIVSGLVFMSSKVGECLLSLYSVPPLESCTYMGLDSGAEPIQFSLFFDILMAMTTGINKEDYVEGVYGRLYNQKAGYSEQHWQTMAMARTLIWKTLSRFKMSSVLLKNCQHLYWTDQVSAKKFIQNMCSLTIMNNYHSVFQIGGQEKTSNYLSMNSFVKTINNCTISSNGAIINSEISVKEMTLGRNCLLSGVSMKNCKELTLNVPDNMVILSFPSPDNVEDQVLVIFGVNNSLYCSLKESHCMLGPMPWSEFFSLMELKDNDIWTFEGKKSLDNSKCLFTAHLYPSQSAIDTLSVMLNPSLNKYDIIRWKQSKRYSIEELVKSINYMKVMDQKRDIYSKVATMHIKQILVEMEEYPLLPYFCSSSAEGWSNSVIKTLDSILVSESHYAVLTRTLSAMADLLSVMAGKTGGLRTGPGSNKAWSEAFKSLLTGETAKGMQQLAVEREKWLTKPSNVMRAARHYERAAQILIQNCLKSTNKFILLDLTPVPPLGMWAEASCPARIDLQGGWTDTPPICYELGGSVVNVAVLIDEQKPILAKACRKAELNIEMVFGDKECQTKLVITKVGDILDFDQPFAQGALLKAALICAEIIAPYSDLDLEHQLLKHCSSGLEIHSYSNLPHGCGMGTSSILAGAIIAVLWSVTGRKFDKSSIIHAVLNIEQLLTTGGGWQDQVGGILGGVNRAISRPKLPLMVEVNPLCLSESIIQLLNHHLLLIYTGKVRLAKNILQNVIRNWYARDRTIVQCFKDLLSCSILMEAALLKGDLPEIGSLMDRYWAQKKILAPGCEPASIKLIMEVLRSECYGQLLVGAGGGGFMCVLTRKPHSLQIFKTLLSDAQVTEEVTCHSVAIHSSGLSITMNQITSNSQSIITTHQIQLK